MAGSLFILTPVVSAEATSTGKHLVSIHYDGITRTVPTEVKTVKEILDSAGVQINPNDLVEPSLKTPILDDSFNINVYRARPVVITNNGVTFVKVTAFQSPRKIAEEAGLKLSAEDDVKLEQTEDIVGLGSVGEQLKVVRSKQVHLNLYGTKLDMHTRADTVEDFLFEKHIKVDVTDKVNLPLSTPIIDGMVITISHTGSQIVTAEEKIPFSTKTIKDNNVYVGQQHVESHGKPGKKLVTYQLTLRNGKAVKKTVIQEIVLEDATPQVIDVGTKPIELRSGVADDKQRLMTAAGVHEDEFSSADYIISHESGWCPTKWQGEHDCPATYYPATGYEGPGYGLCQSTPAIKMATAGADWETNPITQLVWCTGYARGRYGGWVAAYDHWLVYHSW